MKFSSSKKLVIEIIFIVVFGLLNIIEIDNYFLGESIVSENITIILKYILQIALWLAIAVFVNQVIIILLWERKNSPKAPKLLKNIVTILVFVSAITGIIGFVFKQSLNGFWATSSVFAIVIGFALRNVIMDMFAGLAVNIDQPYKIGDWIMVHQRLQEQNIVGKVIDINWRTTRIQTSKNTMLVIPNSLLTTFVVTNFSNPEEPTRFEIFISIDQEIPVDHVTKIILAGAKNVSDYHGFVEEEPEILVDRISERGIDYKIRFWIKPWIEISPSRARNVLLRSILKHIDHAGIKPAYPKETVYHAPFQISKDIHKERQEILRMNPLFNSLLDEEILQLSESIKDIEFEQNKYIITIDDDGDSMFIISEGIVDVFLKKNNKETKIARLGPGEFFGEMSLFTGESRSATVKAVTSVRALEINKQNIEKILQNRPEISNTLIKIISNRTKENISHLEQFSANDNRKDERVKQQLLLKIKNFFKIAS